MNETQDADGKPSFMARFVPGTLVVLGVCAGALGASGFHHPIDAGHAAETGDATERTGPAGAASPAEREPGSMALFLAGSLALGVGGFLVRMQRRSGAGEAASSSARRETLERIQGIRDRVAALRERAPELSGGAIAEELTDLIEGDLFDLTSGSEEFLLRVGFKEYASIWDGVATGERLIARAWSMCTDGFPEEGREELDHALAAFDRSVAASPAA